VLSKLFLRRIPDAFGTGANAASGFGDLLVCVPLNPLFEIDEPGLGEDRMRVGIDKSRDYDSACTIKRLDVRARAVSMSLNMFTCTDGYDSSRDAENCSFLNDVQLRELSSASGTLVGETRFKSEELTDIDEEKGSASQAIRSGLASEFLCLCDLQMRAPLDSPRPHDGQCLCRDRW